VKPGKRRALLLLPHLLLSVLLGGCLAAVPFDEEQWRRRVEETRGRDLYGSHRDGSGRFFNPWDPMERGGFLRWLFSRNSMDRLRDRVPETPVVENRGDYLAEPAASWSITHIGHATFAVHWGGQVVLTDPFFGPRAAVVPRIVPPPFGPEVIPPGSVVVISHNHYDHLDEPSVAALASKAAFLCPLGLGEWLRGKGAKDVRELDWWESVELDGTTFTALPAQHWSRRFGQGLNRTLWCSWMMERDGRMVYYGADSGYFKGYREFGRRYPGMDVALLPIGAYEPRWFMHYAHLNIPEALRAFDDLGARFMIPTQWGVLELGDEPAGWPAAALGEALAGSRSALSARVKILPVGGRLVLD